MPKSQTSLLKLLLSAVFALLVSLPVIALVVALELEATIPQGGAVSPTELSEVEALILENAPSSTYRVSKQLITLSEEEMNLLLRYSLSTLDPIGHWGARLNLRENALDTRASIGFELAGLPAYLNIEAMLHNQGNTLQISELTIGGLSIPKTVITFMVDRLKSSINSSRIALEDVNSLVANIESIAIDPSQLQLTLQWDPVLMSKLGDQTRQLFISDLERQRVGHYYQFLSDVIAATPLDIRAISLNHLLVPLFTEANERSNSGSDAIAENRAVFQALAIYVNEEDIAQFLGDDNPDNLIKAKPIEVRLQRRQDLAKHLASIASITASAGAELAAMVSITKEAYDARYRSGFSFSDLTANTVGVGLASIATRDIVSARNLQQRLMTIKTESEYMPTVGSNRDGLSESDFTDLYVDTSSTQYLDRMEEINSLVYSTPVFADLLSNP